MHVLCDDAGTLGDDVIPVCPCCDLWVLQIHAPRGDEARCPIIAL